MSLQFNPYNPPYLVFDPQDFDDYWKSFQPKDGQLICKSKTNMKQQIALSIEQMQKLRTLGMDCSDASMCWITTRCNDTRLALRPEASRLLDDHLLLSLNYAYTLEDVLINLPPSLDVDNIQYDLLVHPHWLHELWTVKYFNVSGDLKSISAGHLMKVAFEMLKWVLKNHPDKIRKL